ncbi:MAG: tetratricopeptide repeat protein [Marinicella sp.]
MTHKKSLFSELVERRVPQILGMYVAAVWLAVEMADWMSERFEIHQQFSSYVFVIMIAFLPLIGLLAWGHGRPGKDKWTQKQLIFIPFNLVIAWFAVTSFIKPEVQATEIMSLVDEHTGQIVEYEVARAGLNQKITGFFWENKTGDESLDWLSYGAMWMVGKDLMRSPIITIQTPYDSDSMLTAIRSRGFDDAIGEPLSLDLSLASEKDAQWIVKGEIAKDGEKIEFQASLFNVVTGALVTTISATHDDWLFALDDVAEELGAFILEKANFKPSLIPDLAIAEHISTDLGAIKEVIKALNSITFSNDYMQGVEHLKVALELDNSLAEAYVMLVDLYRGLGDLDAAKEASEEALKLDDKLYRESVFKVKANYYAVNGEQDKAIKVLENWVKIIPDSAEALQALGSNYIMVGQRLDDALQVYEKLSELQESSSSVLVTQAKIYRLKGDKEKAISTLQGYLSKNQGQVQPYLEMAATYLQFGDLQEAKDMYDEASLLSINGIDADIGLAKIMSLSGSVEPAIEQLDELFRKAESDNDKVKILSEKEMVLFMTGRLNEAMDVLFEMRELSQSFMPPLAQSLMFGSKEVAYLASLQKYDEAWHLYEQMKTEAKPPYDKLLETMANTIHMYQGNHEEAAKSMELFKEFVTEMQMTIYDQFIYAADAIELRKLGSYEQALKMHDQAINESKQSVLTLNTLQVIDEFNYQKAITLYEAEQYDEAIELMEDNIRRNPLFAQSYVIKAKALTQLEKFEEAQLVIDQVNEIWMKADPEYKDVQEFSSLKEELQSKL